jgi:hypothetical protein
MPKRYALKVFIYDVIIQMTVLLDNSNDYLANLLSHLDASSLHDLIYRMITVPESDQNCNAVKDVSL